MKKFPRLFLSLLAATLSLSVSMLDARANYQPVITSVNQDGITVRTGGGAGFKVTIDGVVQPRSNIKTYRITPLTVITIDGLPGTFGELKQGMAATVVADLDPKVASSIAANTLAKRLPAPARVEGRNNVTEKSIIGFRVVSVTQNRITIGHPGSKASAYQITVDTTIKVNGAPAKVADIKEGMSVIVSSDGMKASSISAQNTPH